MEVEVQKGFLIPIKEFRRPPSNDAIEAGDALLPIQEKLHPTGCRTLVTPSLSRLRPGDPSEETPHRVVAIESMNPLT